MKQTLHKHLGIKGDWKMVLKNGWVLMAAALAVMLYVGQASANTASADFDRNGVVEIADFLEFLEVFGSRQGDEKYEARYDLDRNGEIGVSDFLIFLDFFGQEVAPPSQRDVLVALYNATDGGNWTNNTNWLTDNDISSWYGVGVSDGSVTALNLWENNLRGTIPPELCHLSNLTYLDLGANPLSGEIPPELGNLSNLTELHLPLIHTLSGEIPPELGNLTNLTQLSLHDNQLTGEIPPELGNLTNLTYLGLNNNQLTGEIPIELGNLTNLTYLGLQDTELSGPVPSELSNLTNLTQLWLGSNKLSGALPQSLTMLTKLENFHFWGEGGLCAPLDAIFQAWLQGIEDHHGPTCSQ